MAPELNAAAQMLACMHSPAAVFLRMIPALLCRQVLALRQLRVLTVRSQSLQRLTAGVVGLALLRRLDLSGNARLEIDADVPLGALWELRSLDLSARRALPDRV